MLHRWWSPRSRDALCCQSANKMLRCLGCCGEHLPTHNMNNHISFSTLIESFIHVYTYVIAVNIVVFRLLYGLAFRSFGFSFDRFLSLVVPCFSRKLEFYSLTCSCYIHFQSGGVQRINKHPQEISSETKSQGLLCG